MATAVQISITVDSEKAQAAVAALSESLKKAGVDGDVAFKKASNGVKNLGGHAATGLDSVRLLSQEFGLRLPRALESMISRIPGITSGLQGVLGVMAGIAAAQVFVHVAAEIYQAYEQYVSLNAVADKYYETLKKTRDADFGNARDMETARMRQPLANSNYISLDQQAKDTRAKSMTDLNPVTGVADFLKARDLEQQAYEWRAKSDAVARSIVDKTHEQNLAEFEVKHAGDSALVGAQKTNAELAKKIALNAEARRYTIDVDRQGGNVVAANAGAGEEATANEIARK